MTHVCRELRKRQARGERGRGGGGPASVTLAELAKLFHGFGFTHAMLAARLRERCGCQPLRVRLPCSCSALLPCRTACSALLPLKLHQLQLCAGLCMTRAPSS